MPEVPSPKGTAARVAVTLKVTLRGFKPPLWRRIVVPGTMALGGLHVAIQVAMGWTDSHLHAFDVGGRRFGDPRQLDDTSNEDRMTVARVIASGVERFGYTLEEALADPEHPDHAERSDWLGGALDPEAFSLEEINAALEAAFAPVKGRRGVWSKA